MVCLDEVRNLLHGVGVRAWERLLFLAAVREDTVVAVLILDSFVHHSEVLLIWCRLVGLDLLGVVARLIIP